MLRSHITLTVCIFSFIFHNKLLRALLSCLHTSLLLIAVITVFLFTWRAALLLHSSSNLKNDVRVPMRFLNSPVTCCHQGERHGTNGCGCAQMSDGSCSHLHFLVIIGIDVFAETLHICTICNKEGGSAEAARLIIKGNQPPLPAFLTQNGAAKILINRSVENTRRVFSYSFSFSNEDT